MNSSYVVSEIEMIIIMQDNQFQWNNPSEKKNKQKKNTPLYWCYFSWHHSCIIHIANTAVYTHSTVSILENLKDTNMRNFILWHALQNNFTSPQWIKKACMQMSTMISFATDVDWTRPYFSVLITRHNQDSMKDTAALLCFINN